jgi:hypothetical protein
MFIKWAQGQLYLFTSRCIAIRESGDCLHSQHCEKILGMFVWALTAEKQISCSSCLAAWAILLSVNPNARSTDRRVRQASGTSAPCTARFGKKPFVKLRFQVLTAVNAKITVFWGLTACSLVERYQPVCNWFALNFGNHKYNCISLHNLVSCLCGHDTIKVYFSHGKHYNTDINKRAFKSLAISFVAAEAILRYVLLSQELFWY